jgi:hypothetical protein
MIEGMENRVGLFTYVTMLPETTYNDDDDNDN